LSPDTAIVKIIPESVDDEDEDDSLMMWLFLDFATTEALKNNNLQPYTTEMSEAAHKLIEGGVSPPLRAFQLKTVPHCSINCDN
jgi:antitoxin PrlF